MRRFVVAAWLIALTGPLAAAAPDELPSRATVDPQVGAWQPASDGRLSRSNELTRSVPPQDTRLLVAPTARALKRGHGYVGVSEIFVPFFQVGITDRFSIGAGKPLVFAAGFNPVWITPKLQVVAGDSVQAAVGVIHMTGVGGGRDAGLAYQVTTIGHPDRSASIGVGYGYSGGNRAAIVMLGGEVRTGPNVKWIADSWLWPGGPSFVSGGVRVLRRRLSADAGVVMLLGTTVPVPFVTFAWRF